MLTLLVLLETIATVLSVIGAILVAQNTDKSRHYGFRIWIVSNIFWIWFGWLGMTYGVIITFGTYMICNLVATYRNGKEYNEVICSCGYRTGYFHKKGSTLHTHIHCTCGQEIQT